MKILYIWHAAVEKNYRKLFSEMAKENEIFLITSHRWYEGSRDQFFNRDPEIDKNFKIFKFFAVFHNHIRSFFYLNFFKMIYILLKVNPEVIYLREEPFSINAFQWVFLAKIFSKNAKIVIESDENLLINHPKLFLLIEKYVLNKIDCLACVPTKGEELYRSKNFKKKILKTFNFYNEELFKPIAKNIAIKELKLSLSSNPIIFGYAGRITEEKGIEDLLNAFLMLFKENQNTMLLIAGKGETSYENKLKSFVKENNINVYFLGPLPLEKLVFFYNALDALILPSHSTSWWIEQFGRVIIESMACGTPVIGSSSGEIPVVINNNELIFEEKNTSQLFEIMKKFAEGKIKKEKISESVLKEAYKYSIKNVAENKLNIMKETLKC
jgi:glycosyltransferase involved in cell wall biosynthesis